MRFNHALMICSHCGPASPTPMRRLSRGRLFGSPATVLLIAAATWLAGMTVRADDTNLVVTDSQIHLGLPAAVTDAMPLHLTPKMSAEYATGSPDGDYKVEKMVVEEGIKYPTLWGGIQTGSTVGETVLPATSESKEVEAEDRVYLTTWLNKQWAGVNLSVAHTHSIDRCREQIVYGLSKTFTPFTKKLTLSVGEYLLNDIGTTYWYETRTISLDSSWGTWVLSLFAEEQGDAYAQERSAGIQVKSAF